jgi:hypothetical protein
LLPRRGRGRVRKGRERGRGDGVILGWRDEYMDGGMDEEAFVVVGS